MGKYSYFEGLYKKSPKQMLRAFNQFIIIDY